MTSIKSVEWVAKQKDKLVPGSVRILDQTLLPTEISYIETTDIDEVWTSIKTLQVRGAPAIGVAAAMGLAAAFQNTNAKSEDELMTEVQRLADHLATSRPTAVNLFWALERMRHTAEKHLALGTAELKEILAREALSIRNEDAAMCRAIGAHGAELLKSGNTILTHCNAGGLATSEYGTALAPVYTAHEQGKTISVYADETRPLLQGARLTTWELMQAGIDVTLICDNTAAQVMKEGLIDAVLVGADRIAANGDAANKIGTYGLAVLAQAHKIPFYVLAPTSTIDPDTPNGSAIPIEERKSNEVTKGFGRLTAPKNVKVYSPAFDVTPAKLITGIICEKGIANPDFSDSLASFLR
ncbi:MAG: S-methyl-5-thioribose-1-phosphate isomerase [Kiritimatiellae bacterium]|nr:S-methyl-5-thioribose-1-phosphate isomerase [Kiritimatiellia bacterium]